MVDGPDMPDLNDLPPELHRTIAKHLLETEVDSFYKVVFRNGLLGVRDVEPATSALQAGESV